MLDSIEIGNRTNEQRHISLPIQLRVTKARVVGLWVSAIGMFIALLLALFILYLDMNAFFTGGYCIVSKHGARATGTTCLFNGFAVAGIMIAGICIFFLRLTIERAIVARKMVMQRPFGPHLTLDRIEFWHGQLSRPIRLADIETVDERDAAVTLVCAIEPTLEFRSLANRGGCTFLFSPALFTEGKHFAVPDDLGEAVALLVREAKREALSQSRL